MTIAVLGGGPAGAAAAASLAAMGERVVLLERDAAPHDKVCGDFLSIEAQAALARYGVDPAALGAAPIGTLRLCHGRRTAEAALPFPALGLSRRRLDAALLDHAAACGAEVRRGVRALALHPDGAVDTTAGPLAPAAVFLATGKHALRGAGRARSASASATWVGFKTYMGLVPDEAAALRGVVELVLFDGGYAGWLLVEGGAANLSLIVSAARLADAGGNWDALLCWLRATCPALDQRLEGATPLRARALAVSHIPYGFLHRPDGQERIWRIGDQAAVIPSLTGDGVALALHTAGRAAAAWREGAGPGAFHAALGRELRGQMRRAQWLHRACLATSLQGGVVALCRRAPPIMTLAAALTRIRGGDARGTNVVMRCAAQPEGRHYGPKSTTDGSSGSTSRCDAAGATCASGSGVPLASARSKSAVPASSTAVMPNVSNT